jgi:hypothetical protein
METERVSEMLDSCSKLTRLVTREDFITLQNTLLLAIYTYPNMSDMLGNTIGNHYVKVHSVFLPHCYDIYIDL